MNFLPAHIRATTTCDARPGDHSNYDSHATRKVAKSKRTAPCGKCQKIHYAKRLDAQGCCLECRTPKREPTMADLIAACTNKMSEVK